MAKQTITFETTINAPVEKVWDMMLGVTDKKTYEEWTTAFSPGSTYEGAWEVGSKIEFVDQEHTGGMIAEIAENRPYEFLSIKHLSMIKDGKPDLEEAKEWFPAFENYTFTSKDGGTHLSVSIDMAEPYVEMFSQMWPKALEKLKAICEA